MKNFLPVNSTSGWIQTNDPRFRRPLLYSLSYWGSLYCDGSGTVFLNISFDKRRVRQGRTAILHIGVGVVVQQDDGLGL